MMGSGIITGSKNKKNKKKKITGGRQLNMKGSDFLFEVLFQGIRDGLLTFLQDKARELREMVEREEEKGGDYEEK